MEAPTLPSNAAEANDVFSISDQALSDRLQFIQEIGFGNWGSVWLCRPKLSSSPADGLANSKGQKIAVKLVHRSKTSTTAARVRSLWNEMKIVRTFKNDPHPSIIPFHSFVLTPSYALITMTYLPTLVPVEVEESKAKEWIRFLLSAIDFLHQRGVVHNDIKPANILLSHKNVPVLVDFGFAEKYELDSPTAFHSNLSYGTPEYLAPERARGLPHDTRKSDVWSLGITFFEILIGRTPFETSDGEQLTTKEDLENYWQRTLKGTWMGNWKISSGMEKLLQRMIAPNADLRCTASQAMADEFWHPCAESATIHRRSSSYTSSVVFEKDMIKLLNLTPSSARSNKENLKSPPGLESPLTTRKVVSSRTLTKSKSQPKVATSKTAPTKKRPYVPPVPDLSPIKASPPVSPLTSASGKENPSPAKRGVPNTPRRAFGVLAARNENLPQGVKSLTGGTTKDNTVKALGDVTHTQGGIPRRTSQDVKSPNNTSIKSKGKESTSARDRVRDWERERERLREIARLEEIEREREDEEVEREKEQDKVKKRKEISINELEANKENHHRNVAFSNTVLPLPAITPPLTQVLNFMSNMETPTRPTSSQSKKFGHVIRASIDKTLHAYKTSTFGQVTGGRSTPARSLDIDPKDIKSEIVPPRARGTSQTQSWENEVNSSLPVVRNALQNEKVAADSRKDRLAIWMQNVERVVEDARQNFAASAKLDAPLPSLPVAPSSRRSTSRDHSNRSTRLPRKVLAASQIFAEHNSSIMVDTSSSVSTAPAISDTTISTGPPATPADTRSGSMFSPLASAEPSQGPFIIPEIHTPSRQRRATLGEDSPIAIHKNNEMSPSKRREKSRSHGNLLQQRIASLTQLEAEINKPLPPEPSPRLSEMFDRSIFIASPIRSCDDLESPHNSSDDLTSSPYRVEPYPQRKLCAPDALPDTPGQRRLEGVYDRFLMATSGVKRVGKGYQSEFIPPPPSFPSASGPGLNRRHSKVLFGSPKTPMPPPVSSEDIQRRGVSMDELGVISYDSLSSNGSKEEPSGHSTVGFMRKAIKAIVPSTKNPKRHSRMLVA